MNRCAMVAVVLTLGAFASPARAEQGDFATFQARYAAMKQAMAVRDDAAMLRRTQTDELEYFIDGNSVAHKKRSEGGAQPVQ